MKNYKVEVFNEICILGVSNCLFFFSDYVKDPSSSSNLGWVLIGIILFNILTNSFLLIVNTIKDLITSFKFICWKIKNAMSQRFLKNKVKKF